jgi:2-oxoglutarate dehydrogenase E1 component
MDTRKVGQNDNLPDFSTDQKSILRKLNEAVSFENFCTLNMWGKNVFHWKESIIPALDTLIERAAEMEWSNL